MEGGQPGSLQAGCGRTTTTTVRSVERGTRGEAAVEAGGRLAVSLELA